MAVDYRMKIKATDNTKGAFNSTNKNINKTQNALKKMAGLFAGAFAAGKMIQFGNSALQMADAVGKAADSVGVSVEFLQRFQFAAQQAGLSTEEFNKGMQNFTKMVGQAQIRTTEAGRTLEKLGVQVKNTDGSVKGAEEVFVDLFHALDGVGSQFEKNAILADLLGRAGVKLAVMGKSGADAMELLAASATGVFDEETVRMAEAFNDTLNRLKRSFVVPLQKEFIILASTVMSVFETMGLIKPDLFTKSIDQLNTMLDEQIDKRDELLRKQDRVFDLPVLGETRIKPAFDLDKQLAETRAFIKEIEAFIRIQKKQEENQKLLNGTIQFGNELNGEAGNIIKDNIEIVKTFAETIEGKLTNAFTEFFDFTGKKFLDFGNLAQSVIRAIINELVQMFLVQKAVGLIKGFLDIPRFGGDILGTPTGNEIPAGGISFAGGGFTGMGVRAGGVDGRGGFPAILHPRESVIDHTKGQGMGATVNFNISTIDATGFDELLATRKGLITSIINNAMNNRGRMGVA
jgi:hypothetical protein